MSRIHLTNRNTDLALLLLRGITGAIFAAHGAQKLFVFGFDGVSGAFAQMGVPLAPVIGPSVALLEFFGGLALAVGIFTRLASLGLLADMLGALFIVHLPNGFFLPNGAEFVLALGGLTGALALTGPGSFSLDARLGRETRHTDGPSIPMSTRKAA